MAEVLDADFDMEEGEEEPLFIDDDLEDPPPLPPPMPSLSQLNQHHSTDHYGGEPATQGNMTGTLPAPQDNSQEPSQKKKRKPILTLTVDRIFSEKGLPYLETEFPKLKFKGKGHEVSDLKNLMQQYEHWANRLYPKFTFKDVTQRIERLSTTKDFKNRLLTIRRRHSRGGAVTPPFDEVNCDEEGSHNNPSTSHRSPPRNVPEKGASSPDKAKSDHHQISLADDEEQERQDKEWETCDNESVTDEKEDVMIRGAIDEEEDMMEVIDEEVTKGVRDERENMVMKEVIDEEEDVVTGGVRDEKEDMVTREVTDEKEGCVIMSGVTAEEEDMVARSVMDEGEGWKSR